VASPDGQPRQLDWYRLVLAPGSLARTLPVSGLLTHAEAGYGMRPAGLTAALRSAGAAGCNLEDTNHADGSLRDPDRQAEWLRAVRQAATADGYRLVINVQVDMFFGPFLGRSSRRSTARLGGLRTWERPADFPTRADTEL
jgi:hypothetical protein